MKSFSRSIAISAIIGLAVGLIAAVAAETTAPSLAPVAELVPKMRKNDLSPLAATEKAIATHAPFETGECSLCHQRNDPKSPGPITTPVNEQCLGCHDDYQKLLSGKSSHVPARESCVSCHNPHNARQPKLLVEEASALCLGCHEKIQNLAQHSTVKHDALTSGAKCANCHNPHGANVEHLLIQLPMNLCLSCHNKDDMKDNHGRTLTNFKQLLADNPRQHNPVASGDCSACHNPHGYDNFRLLNQEYPATFYATFEAKNYALCFECHEERLVTDPETTTQTKFRDGRRNLHYLHVNKTERGRTCRACHEVHAAKQKALIRESVPYGPKNWPLKLNFSKTETGGTCTKTCHTTRSYNNTAAATALQK